MNAACLRFPHRGVRLIVAFVLLATGCLLAYGCKKDDPPTAQNGGQTTNGSNDTLPPPCESQHDPIIFLHGFLASGDTWAPQVMRFTSNNYCSNLLYVFDWNTLNFGSDVEALDRFIDSVRSLHSGKKVNLVGHSAGGGYGYTYCEAAERAAKIAHYVHIGSSSQSSPAGPNDEVPTLCISSPDDKTTGSSTITGAVNISIAGKDHYQIATCAETFREMYKFFNNGREPATTDIVLLSGSVQIGGRVLTLGENVPIENASVNIYRVHPETGERTESGPVAVLKTGPGGYWGPQAVEAGITYEFEVISGKPNDRVIYYYREGFRHHNPLVYLRTVPPAGSLAGLLLSALPKNDNQTVLAVFTASQATIAGRDELIVANTTLSTPEITPASATVIATFLYDDNNNQETDLTKPLAFLFVTQFLTARDMYFQTATPQPITLSFNGRKLVVRNRKSASEGIVVAVFD
ncbi:MAG: alpha/beta fold hydrolase [Chitinophagales bacterium]|nr:alpha/beta fold hydrolase [Chitinophagales bacterium]MDW8427315.1 alpha/beta fold hydrolase [Chitinophagales bacterium]